MKSELLYVAGWREEKIFKRGKEIQRISHISMFTVSLSWKPSAQSLTPLSLFTFYPVLYKLTNTFSLKVNLWISNANVYIALLACTDTFCQVIQVWVIIHRSKGAPSIQSKKRAHKVFLSLVWIIAKELSNNQAYPSTFVEHHCLKSEQNKICCL